MRNTNVPITKYDSFGSYKSARTSTYDGYSSTNAAGSFHQRYDRTKLISQSRAFLRDNAIYNAIIDRSVRYIVKNGFNIQIKTSSNKWNQKAEDLWNKWWRCPDIGGILAGSAVEQMICRELFICGDTALLKIAEDKSDVTKDRIQLIEAEQIVGPGLNDDGIITTPSGRIIKFSIAPWNNGGISIGGASEYSTDEVLFISNPLRPTEYRGVPICQSIFPMLHRINDVCDSEAASWQMLSRLAIAITRESGPEQAFEESGPSDRIDSNDDDLSDRIVELDYATIFNGEPGDDIRGIERNIPGSNFSESITMFLRLLGSPIGLPLELILLDWTKSNYSQSRAVIEQAYQNFKAWQNLLITQIYDKLYEWRIKSWIDAGLLRNRDDAFNHTWITPTFPWIDQFKETQAYGAKLDRGFITLSQVCKEQSLDRSDVLNVREMEIREAIARSDAIMKETGETIPWQMFAGLDPANFMNIRLAEETGEYYNTRNPDNSNDVDDTEDETDDN